jgi:hypothetical protein
LISNYHKVQYLLRYLIRANQIKFLPIVFVCMLDQLNPNAEPKIPFRLKYPLYILHRNYLISPECVLDPALASLSIFELFCSYHPQSTPNSTEQKYILGFILQCIIGDERLMRPFFQRLSKGITYEQLDFILKSELIHRHSKSHNISG